MILRSTKLVASPAHAEEAVRLYRAYTQPFTRQCSGSVAVRLYRHIETPNTFFVHSWWRSLEDVRLATAQPEYAAMAASVREIAIERLSTWELAVDRDHTHGLRVEPAGTEVMRTARVVARPGEVDRLRDLYEAHTHDHLLRQRGCLGVRAMRLLSTPNTFFTQSYWRHRADLAAVLAHERHAALLAAVVPLVLERIRAWNLSLLEDDPEVPLFALPGAGGHAGVPVAMG